MTINEAIDILRCRTDGDAVEALEMAIQALEQEHWICPLCKTTMIKYPYPIIEQEPKTGHWIERRSRATGHIESVCSECGAEEGYPYNDYCGNCGAKMESEG